MSRSTLSVDLCRDLSHDPETAADYILNWGCVIKLFGLNPLASSSSGSSNYIDKLMYICCRKAI